ncbi:MAG: 7-cyano-7-deazaguanine synthase QueC [Candidatus Altiarchaeales archaeon]|nr:MAG: 7-cyano-7-deazaguanine synthase QueC [Candidatus Altiarchaeales archaeon]
MKRAICLLSGGVDSAVASAIAKDHGYEIYAITFDYGQRHKKEIECAKKLAEFFRVREHKIFRIDLNEIGNSALTSNKKIPERGIEEIKNSRQIPETYVPARNTIMLSFALAYAEVKGADAIFIGANCIDYSGYPDCRPEYFKKFQEMADLATKMGVEGRKIRIETPVIEMNKADIIKKGFELGVPFQYTWSCYRGGEKACGKCDSCVLRLNGFKEAGFRDPIEYENEIQNQ